MHLMCDKEFGITIFLSLLISDLSFLNYVISGFQKEKISSGTEETKREMKGCLTIKWWASLSGLNTIKINQRKSGILSFCLLL